MQCWTLFHPVAGHHAAFERKAEAVAERKRWTTEEGPGGEPPCDEIDEPEKVQVLTRAHLVALINEIGSAFG